MNGRCRRAVWTVRIAAVLVGVAGATAPLSLEGQEYPRPEIAVVHAQGEYDLSGVGWTHLYSVRVPVALNRWWIVEPGLTYFDYRTQSSQDVGHLIPELQTQLTPLHGRFRPYLGIGVGATRVALPEDTEWLGTLSAAGGVRVGLTDSWSVLGELRLWAIDPWTGVVSGFGGGVARRF